MDLLARMQNSLPPMIEMLGVELVEVGPDRIVATMEAREQFGNGVGILHGGAYMTFADFLGALGTVVNLPKGAGTTTIESKTNFIAPAKTGSRLKATSTPLHKGRRTMVWQTRIESAEGRLLALVTQTQMVLEAQPD